MSGLEISLIHTFTKIRLAHARPDSHRGGVARGGRGGLRYGTSAQVFSQLDSFRLGSGEFDDQGDHGLPQPAK